LTSSVIFDTTYLCNIRRTDETLLWTIPQWHFVFISEDVMRGFPLSKLMISRK